MGIDALLDITYDLKKDEFTLEGNVKEEHYKEFLSNYLQDLAMGAVGEISGDVETALGSSSEAEEKGIYRILIGLRLIDDHYSACCNTVNNALRNGIIGNIFGRIGGN